MTTIFNIYFLTGRTRSDSEVASYIRKIKRVRLLSVLLFIPGAMFAQAGSLISEMQTEHLTSPIGIDVQHPRLSWAEAEGTTRIADVLRRGNRFGGDPERGWCSLEYFGAAKGFADKIGIFSLLKEKGFDANIFSILHIN